MSLRSFLVSISKGSFLIAAATLLSNVADVRKHLIELFPSIFSDHDIKLSILAPDSGTIYPAVAKNIDAVLKLYFVYTKEDEVVARDCHSELILQKSGDTLRSVEYTSDKDADPPAFPQTIDRGKWSKRVGGAFSANADKFGGKASSGSMFPKRSS
jgi:hypothetical protein